MTTQPDPAATIAAAYQTDGPSVELGAVVIAGTAQPESKVRLPLAMMNRHGLVAGATGTGKTKTLQLIAEQLSAAGVPVLLADVKGDLSGVAAPGAASDRTTKRATEVGRHRLAAGRGAGGVPDAGQRRQGRAAALDDDQLRPGAAEQGSRTQRRAVVLPRPGLPLGGQGRPAAARPEGSAGRHHATSPATTGAAELAALGRPVQGDGRRHPARADRLRRSGRRAVLRRARVRHRRSCCARHPTARGSSRSSSSPRCRTSPRCSRRF